MYVIKLVYNDGKTITLDLANQIDKESFTLAVKDIAEYSEDDLKNPYAIKSIEPSKI